MSATPARRIAALVLTTIYGNEDRYRDITGQRDVVFDSADDVARRGWRIAIWSKWWRPWARAGKAGAVAHATARDLGAAYHPEANHPIALDDHDAISRTPADKMMPVTPCRASASPAA